MMYVTYSFISKKVVHNYLAFISVENILSGIDIQRIVTSYIWNINGVFLFDPRFDELFVKVGSGEEPKLKE